MNSVHPTGVNTPMGTGGMQAEIGAAIAGNDRLGAMFINMLPVEQTEPEDVADTVLFLASDESKFITAHEIAPTPALRSSEMASTRDWFETVAEAQRRARRQLPRSVYLALVARAEAGSTMKDNVAAFGELRFRPHMADLPSARDLSTTVMGQEVSFPVLISPTGVQAVHPDGEVAVARAAVAAGTAMGLPRSRPSLSRKSAP